MSISDKKLQHTTNGTTVDYYEADVMTAQDYYPGGMMMVGRKYEAASGYRYGFNGKENDNEVKGEGNQQDYGMRIYDTRLGKFISTDPLTISFPQLTPYQFASNSPIANIDLDGLESYYTADGRTLGNGPDKGNTEIRIAHEYTIKKISIDCTTTIYTTVTSYTAYRANSEKTLKGRNENTAWDGITELSSKDLSLLNDFVAGFVVKIKGTIESAMLSEANAGPNKNPSKLLDFKHQIFTLLGIPYFNLIAIDGVLYNPNEAGNYVWGMVTEMAGSFLNPNFLGHLGSLADEGRLDEEWDQKAMSAGREKAHSGEIQRTGMYEKIVDFYSTDYYDFIKEGGDKGSYIPSINGMLKHFKDFQDNSVEVPSWDVSEINDGYR